MSNAVAAFAMKYSGHATKAKARLDRIKKPVRITQDAYNFSAPNFDNPVNNYSPPKHGSRIEQKAVMDEVKSLNDIMAEA